MTEGLNSQNLNWIFQQQRQAYLKNPYPSYEQRHQMILKLKKALILHQKEILNALHDDFGHRLDDESRLIEFLPTISSMNYILKHLKEWMTPEKRAVSLLHMPAKNYVFYQPKGVVGILVPWNYPVFLSVVPMAYAIAAGNSLMLKLSELTPKVEKVLKKICLSLFLETKVSFISGDHNVASTFSYLPFDHLFFTGSSEIGRLVMQAASMNLTPVTLELGGKSPVIIAKKANLRKAALSIMFAKYINSGQTCVAPDYIYCPNDLIIPLVKLLKKSWNQLTKSKKSKRSKKSEHHQSKLTTLISNRQLEHIKLLIDDARNQGATLEVLGGDDIWQNGQLEHRQNRQLPLTLVLNVKPSMLILQKEIFGPILPIIGYDSFDEVIDKINQNPRPLSLYFYGDKKIFERVRVETHSGGLCFNDALIHIAQDDLPFGGIGPSGMGAYHAKEGFITFSHAKAIHQKRWLSFTSLAYPPFNWINRLIFKLFIR